MAISDSISLTAFPHDSDWRLHDYLPQKGFPFCCAKLERVEETASPPEMVSARSQVALSTRKNGAGADLERWLKGNGNIGSGNDSLLESRLSDLVARALTMRIICPSVFCRKGFWHQSKSRICERLF